MKRLYCLPLAIAALGLSGCGDPNSLGGDTSPLAGTNGGASGSGGTAAGGASGSGGTAAGGGGVGAGSGSLPDEATLSMGPFAVEPGGEAFVCQTFANPFAGSDVFLREFESHMTPGSHHLLMNAVPDAPSGLGPCSGLEPPTGPFATQIPDDVFSYPEGVAAELAGTNNLRLISHYVNVSPATLNVGVAVTLRRARPESVRQVALVGAMNQADINVPPRQSQTVEGGLTLLEGREYDMFWILPHMHNRGTNFSVKAGPGAANVIYETDRWEAPARRFNPPLRLYGGDSLNYSCTFFNDSEFPLIFGESAVNHEMCMLVYHYTDLSRPR